MRERFIVSNSVNVNNFLWLLAPPRKEPQTCDNFNKIVNSVQYTWDAYQMTFEAFRPIRRSDTHANFNVCV